MKLKPNAQGKSTVKFYDTSDSESVLHLIGYVRYALETDTITDDFVRDGLAFWVETMIIKDDS